MYCTHTRFSNVESTRVIGGNFTLSNFSFSPFLAWVMSSYMRNTVMPKSRWKSCDSHFPDTLRIPSKRVPSPTPWTSNALYCFRHPPYSPFEIPLAAGCSLPRRDFYQTVRRGTRSAGRNRDTTWIPLPIVWPPFVPQSPPSTMGGRVTQTSHRVKPMRSPGVQE